MQQTLLLYIQKKRNLRKLLHTLILFNFLIYFEGNAFAQPKYEFRGVWVATISNIDWPSSKFVSTENQKAEFISLLDMHQRNGINAVIVQIRPATDAFYPSQYEPWSEWLTGTQGKPPVPYYDPLEFMIKETHNRGMEFHAWMNPYRAALNIDRSFASQTHITRLKPDWFLTYGTLKLFDPGNKEVQQYVTNIVSDVVDRYDIDAVHFDDYFYPYPIAGKIFPDSVSFKKYGKQLNKADWRRSNVDSIILKLGKVIKQKNRFCKFGISPFGVWRNNDKDPQGSNTGNSLSNYDDLYADILLWLKNKWIDYVSPQLYWEMGHRTVGFEKLIDWWANHSYGRHLYIGHGIYRVFEQSSPAWKNRNELPNQIKKLRAYPKVHGSVYYSSKWFATNPNGWNDSLQNNYYKFPAIIPPMAWIDNTKPVIPQLNVKLVNKPESDDIIIHFTQSKSTGVKQYAFYISENREPDKTRIYKLLPSAGDMQLTISPETIPLTRDNFFISVTAISKTNNESENSKVYNLIKKNGSWMINL